MTLDHGGRIYLAKDAVLRAEDFAAMYPKLEAFRAIQRKLDPQRMFSSSLARRLKIVEGRDEMHGEQWPSLMIDLPAISETVVQLQFSE